MTAVRDAAGGEVRLYVDGAEAASPTSDLGVNMVGAANAVLAIGSGVWWFGGSYEHFAGSIDEVASSIARYRRGDRRDVHRRRAWHLQ